MSLLRFDDVCLEFGDQLILRDAEFSIEAGERVCLIGRNGAGKSSTFRLITGELEADRGEITASHNLIVSQLEQTLPEAMDQYVTDVIRDGLTQIGNAEHGGILVDAVVQVIRCGGDHVVGSVAVGKALAEIDRVVLLGEARHDLEYGRPIGRQN